MSWQANVLIPAGSSPAEVQRLLDDMKCYRGTLAEGETEEQFKEAKTVARNLLYSGAFGPKPLEGGEIAYLISLNGHANPNHQPVEGFSGDFVTITVSQRKPEAAGG